MELVMDDLIFETEGEPTDEQVDSIYVLDGRGRAVKVEVPDDD